MQAWLYGFIVDWVRHHTQPSPHVSLDASLAAHDTPRGAMARPQFLPRLKSRASSRRVFEDAGTGAGDHAGGLARALS